VKTSANIFALFFHSRANQQDLWPVR